MTAPSPPSDMTRAERKAFRSIMKRLTERAIDPITRASLAEQLVRLESRLPGLREAEKAASPDKKLAANRALTAATTEARRLSEALFRGAARVRTEAEPTSEGAAEAAWRGWYWRGVGQHQALEAEHGPPTWAALLYPSKAEEEATKKLLAEFSPKSPPVAEWSKLRQSFGGRLGVEWLAPGASSESEGR